MKMKKRTIISIFVAMILLICNFVFADYVAEDVEVIIAKANAGDAYYQGVIGMMYLHSFEVARDFSKAYEFLKQSAEAENAIGMYQIAVMKSYNLIPIQDTLSTKDIFQEPLKKLKEESQKEDAIIQFCLGHAYYRGFGVEKDWGKSLEWNMKSMLQGYDQAEMYFNGLLKDKACTGEIFERIRDLLLEESADNSFAEYALGNVYANADSLNKDIDEAVRLFTSSQKGNIEHGCRVENDDQIIPDLLPPSYYLAIEEGSCIETCLWSVMNSLKKNKTQLEINLSCPDNGLGLHFNEITKVLKQFEIGYTVYCQDVDSSDSLIVSQRYKNFVYDKVVKKVQNGYPVFIGIKSYPTQHQDWFADHLVLVVGYNERTDELIYNDMNKRKRIKVMKLLDTLPGYSFVSDFNTVLAVQLLDF
ncbi:MAG: C39 family peptidase [Candidatus Stygibacter australis]|nr:C39 family peptidase [Candidatus Stygibacter australis]